MTRTKKKARASSKSAERAEAAASTFEDYSREQLKTTTQLLEKLRPPDFARERPLSPDEENDVTQFHTGLNSSFNNMTEEKKLAWVNKVLDETGLNDKQRRAIRDYYVPNSPYKDSMDAESLQIEREKYDLVVKLYMAMTSRAYLKFSKEVQVAICKKFVEDYQGARKKRETHTRNLPNGNIDMGDGNFSWIDNQGKLAVIGITLSILFAHYGTPKEKGYRETCDPHHRGDLDNISLMTMTTTTDKHSIYQTAKANGVEPPDWDTINTSECADKAVVVDADSINMNLPSEECKDEDGKAVSGPEQLDMQRRQFAESSNFSGTNNVKKEEYSILLNLSTILFNILIIKATTGRPAVMVSVGTHSKKLIQKKGDRAFTTSCLYYVGWTYHPQSTNGVRVTILTLLRKSDTVMAIFKTLGVFLRPVVNFYAEYRCNGKFSGKQLKEINDSIGRIGHEYAAIVALIEHHREANWETDLDIFKSIKPTLKNEVSSSAIAGYEKILVLREQVDAIAAKVDRLFNEKGGVMTKKDIFESIKKDDDLNSLSSSSMKKVERMYLGRLAFEKQREDVKTICAELKKAKEALRGGASVDIEAFKDYIRTHHSGISEGALDFVFGGAQSLEKLHEDVKTVSTKLKEAEAEAAASGQTIEATTVLDQIRKDNHELGGAVNFVAGREKQKEDVKTVSTKLKEAEAEAAASGQTIEATTVLDQIRSDNHELGGAVNFVLGCQKFHDEEHIIAAALESLHPNPTHKDITNCIMKLHVSSTAKHKAIMDRHPLQAKKISFQKQMSRLNKECSVSNIERSTHECSKCGGEITYFGNTSSIMSKKGVACLTCQRTGQLDKTVNTRSDKRTSFKRRSTIFCSMEQVKEEMEQLNKQYKRESLELERLLERSSVQAQNDDLDLAAIVSNSVPVRVRVGGDVVSGEGVLSAIVSRPVTVRVRVGEPAQPPAKKRKLDPPPRQQETAQVQRQQQECMMQMMPLLPAITNTSIIDSVASQANSFGTFDFINYDNNESYYESSNYSYLCGAFDI